MKKLLKNFLSSLIIMAMVLGFVGCGNDASETTANGEVTENAESLASDDAMSASVDSGKDSVTVYKIGSDKLAIIAVGPCCEGLAPVGGNEGPDQMYIISDRDDNLQIYLSTFYAGVSSSSMSESISSEWGSVQATKNTYLVEIDRPGVCNEVDFGNKVTVIVGSGEMEEILSGKPSDFVKTISEDEYKSLKVSLEAQKLPTNPAQAPWEGLYFTDGYGDLNGYAQVEVTDSGMVHFKVNFDGEEDEYYLEETMYDCAQYDYGDYTLADCDLNGVGQNSAGKWQYMHDAQYDQVCITYTFDDYSSGVYINASFYPINGSWYTAPEDYVDEDKYGLLSVKDTDDSKYFAPSSDDYILKVNAPSGTYDGNDYLECTLYTLTSFDENSHFCDQRRKYVFENASDAKAVYDYKVSDSYGRGFYLSGNIIYEYFTSDDELDYYRPSVKVAYDMVGSTWYKNVNYIYVYESEDSKEYAYLSKPITDEVVNVSLDDMLYWSTLEYGSHASIDSPDATLYASVSSSSLEFTVSDYSMNDDDYMDSYVGAFRLNGREAVTVSYNTYNKRVFVKEYKFDDEVCEVTEYAYDITDWKNVDVNFDNYKSKTPARTLTHKFDMARVMQ